MSRTATTLLSLALVLAVCASAEAAGKKKKKAAAATTMIGTITAVSDDGKTITVTAMGGKKKNATPAELKLTDKTQVHYLGMPDKSEQKLAVGHVVLVALDETDPTTAVTIAAAKAPAKAAGKGKKKKDQ